MPSLTQDDAGPIIALVLGGPPSIMAVVWLWIRIRRAFSGSRPVQPDLELGNRQAEPVMNEAINDETVNDETVNNEIINHKTVSNKTVNDETVNNDAVNNDAVNNDAATLVSQPGTVLVRDFVVPSVEYSREGWLEPDINHDCIASVVLRPPS